MHEKKISPLYGVGVFTILTVLLILCLTMFAILTLSNARADLRLSEKNAFAVTEYYAADAKGAALLADATSLWNSGERPLPQTLITTLAVDYELTIVEDGAGLVFVAAIPVRKNQMLQLELYLAPPSLEDRWQIRRWQVQQHSIDENTAENFLPVWQGE